MKTKMSKDKLTGTLEYYGNEIAFKGTIDLQVKALTLFLLKNPSSTKKWCHKNKI